MEKVNSRAGNLAKRPESFLIQNFQSRRERNPAYSISAFARDLGVSVSLVSRVFAGTRPMTLKLAMQSVEALGLKEEEAKALIQSVLQSSSKSAKISRKLRTELEGQTSGRTPIFTTVEIERFRAMASWYHLAILNWVALDGSKDKPAEAARQLGISVGEARDAFDRLIAIGLLTRDPEGKLRRTHKNFYFKTRSSEFAVRKFHRQMIQKASDELEKTSDEDFSRRLINSITFTCGPEHVELIKDKIDQLQSEILTLVSSGKQEAVHQMNVQFFPLTKKGDVL